MKAWERTARGKDDGAAALASLPAGSPLAPIADEQRAAMLFALRKPDEALPLAQKVLLQSGGRNTRLRLAYADSLSRLKQPEQALAMLQGDDEALAAARTRLAAGQSLDMAIDTPAAGYAEMLIALAVDLGRDDNKALPIALTQVARHAYPGNSEAAILLGLLLDGDGRPDDALRLLGGIGPDDLLAGEALDVETRILGDKGDFEGALRRAQDAAASPAAGPQDYARLANVLGDMDRHVEAAAAYGQAIGRTNRGGNPTLWTLYLLRAASLEQADRWVEAKAELETAMKLDPDNPLLLNFLGYGKLERGEDLDAGRSDDPQGQRASARRCIDHRLTGLGALQARAAARGDRDPEPRRGGRSRPVGNPRASGRCALCVRAADRGALFVAGGTDRRRGQGQDPARAKVGSRADPRHRRALMRLSEPAPAKLNLALHVRGKLPDGRHALETIVRLLHRWRPVDGRAG